MIDVQKVLRDYFSAVPERTRRLVEAFWSGESDSTRYLFGRTELSAEIANKQEVTGFIDDFFEGDEWLGKPVWKTEAVPRAALVVNCVINAKPVTAHQRLAAMGFENILKFSDVRRGSNGIIALPAFCRGMAEEIEGHAEEWALLYQSLSDNTSRAVLDDLLRFRLTCDYDCMRDYTFRPDDQYFEEFMAYAGETFVDAGGFDGQTTWEFCRRYPDYSGVYLFEPVPASMLMAQRKLAGLRDIYFIAKGVSDSAARLTFDDASGSACAVAEKGSLIIDVVPIDDAVEQLPSFIKMDLEGWEGKALLGARRHILAARPKLAIAVYHRPEDFRELFLYVKSLHQDYKVYVRHYTEGWSETVMYFK